MFSVKMLKDGNRTVIVIEGANEEQDELAYEIIQKLYATKFKKQTQEQPAILPFEEKSESPVVDAVPEEVLPEEAKTEEAPVLESEESLAPPIRQVEGLEPPAAEAAPTTEELDSMIPYEIARRRTAEIMSGGPYSGMTATEALHRYEEAALAPLNSYAKTLPNGKEKEIIIKVCKTFMMNIDPSRFIGRDRKAAFLRNIAKMTTVAPFIGGYQSVDSFVRNVSDAEMESCINDLASALRDRGRR